MRARDPPNSADLFCKAMATVYGGFGVFLATIPETSFGGDSPVSYWTSFGEAGIWFARFLGIIMVSIYTAPFWGDMPAAALAKATLPINILALPMFYMAAAKIPTASGAKNAILPFNLWWTQLPIAIGLLALNVMALK